MSKKRVYLTDIEETIALRDAGAPIWWDGARFKGYGRSVEPWMYSTHSGLEESAVHITAQDIACFFDHPRSPLLFVEVDDGE